MFSGGPITWRSKKQTTVALSSTEAEYMALGDAVKELLWLQQLFDSIGFKFDELPTLFEDNEGCKALVEHPVHHNRTKHIDIRHHFLRSHLNVSFTLNSISTNFMLADIFTKPLGAIKFKGFKQAMGLSG